MFFKVLQFDFSLDQLDELFTFIDTNQDGKISFEEFFDSVQKGEVNYFQLLKRIRR